MGNTDSMIYEYDNPKQLKPKELFQERLDKLNTMDRSTFTYDQIKEIKEEIRFLCGMLFAIEINENEKPS